jgi:pyroglutamyl-peptidase
MAPRRLSSPAVLVTGFEPFGGGTLNPSWLAAQALHGRAVGGHRVVSACLPTTFGDAIESLQALMAAHRPALVLCTGLAANRSALSLERVAINLDDARIPDNRGARPIDRPVVPGGPAAYFSSLPLKAMLQALKDEGLPAEVSQTAGTFVCNHVFYGLMHSLATDPALAGVRGGFVHVPGLEAMPLPQQVLGLRCLLQAALGTSTDISLAAGALS